MTVSWETSENAIAKRKQNMKTYYINFAFYFNVLNVQKKRLNLGSNEIIQILLYPKKTAVLTHSFQSILSKPCKLKQ